MENKSEPFDSIGLCFSGGGYRATFFSLGVISYLNKIKFKNKSLLESVEAISTVSGGSLLGVAYAKAIQDPNFKFDHFYKLFYSSFTPDSDHLLKKAVSKLMDDSIWVINSHKKRTLINAFALAYADYDIYKGDFEMFKKLKNSNLRHICFNASEFSFGLAFRFQNTGMFGNNPLNCKELENISDKIKLADVVASSSCFPLGFEPLVFPDDYFKDKTNIYYKALKSISIYVQGVGIMDGGIVDNQGIGSMINISKSSDRQKSFDLIIVNDVGSYKMDPWLPSAVKMLGKKSLREMVLGKFRYFGIRWAYWITILLGVFIVAINSTELIKARSFFNVLGGIIIGIGLSLTVFGLLTFMFKKKVASWFEYIFKKMVPKVLNEEVTAFHGLDFALIKQMLNERMTSTVKMVNEVFLNQIRRLNYDLIYSKDEYKNKIITSTVYELNGQETLYKKKPNSNIPRGKQLENIALIASEAPTTLWWDKNDISNNRLDSLIACGQFTTCYNLIDYILKLKNGGLHSVEIDALYALLKEDWEKFNQNPLFMV